MNATRSIHTRSLSAMYNATYNAPAKGIAAVMPSAPFQAARFQTRMATMGRMGLWWVVGMTLLWGALLLTTQSAAAQSFQLFVPAVSTEGVGPGGTGEEPVECGLNDEETGIAQHIEADARQGRDNPVCNSILAKVARARAKDMALRGYFSHTNPDGEGPNLLVREAGYRLPDWYADDQNSNNIESIGAGFASSEEAWEAWIASSKHRTHLLGTEDFYAGQDAYGVGYYFNPDSPYRHYWVFISAPIEE